MSKLSNSTSHQQRRRKHRSPMRTPKPSAPPSFPVNYRRVSIARPPTIDEDAVSMMSDDWGEICTSLHSRHLQHQQPEAMSVDQSPEANTPLDLSWGRLTTSLHSTWSQYNNSKGPMSRRSSERSGNSWASLDILSMFGYEDFAEDNDEDLSGSSDNSLPAVEPSSDEDTRNLCRNYMLITDTLNLKEVDVGIRLPTNSVDC